MISVDDYNDVKDCVYKDEHYSVRDNGAVMRHQREGMRVRKDDNVWTFGKPNDKTGYMEIAGQRVHRIVAFAFLGNPPTDQHVVDHIDTNRRNNRPENLRWLTRLENALNNPVTRKMVELICGSVEAFLKNPKLLWGHESEDKNFSWMKTVSKDEAQNCLANWNKWIKSVKPDSNYKKTEHQIGDWIFDKQIPNKPENSETLSSDTSISFNRQEGNSLRAIEEVNAKEKGPVYCGYIDENECDITDDDYKNSLTPSAKQLLLNIDTLFPCCPPNVNDNGLEDYYANLKIGALFSSNWKYKFFVVKKKYVPGKKTLVVLIERNEIGQDYRDYYIAYVFIRKGYFAHFSKRSSSDIEIATRDYKIAIGEEKPTEEEMLNWDC